VDLVRPQLPHGTFLARAGLDPQKPVVGILPGSRPQEVAHNLPPLERSIIELAARRPELQFLLAVAPSLDVAALAARLRHCPVRLVSGATHSVLDAATVALVASGTATVEAALLDTPMVVVYRLAPLTYALGRPFVRVSHFAMVNLIAGRRVVPELIQRDFTPEKVVGEALSLLDDPSQRAQMRRGLEEVRARLGGPGASSRAAAAVFGILDTTKKT